VLKDPANLIEKISTNASSSEAVFHPPKIFASFTQHQKSRENGASSRSKSVVFNMTNGERRAYRRDETPSTATLPFPDV